MVKYSKVHPTKDRRLKWRKIDRNFFNEIFLHFERFARDFTLYSILNNAPSIYKGCAILKNIIMREAVTNICFISAEDCFDFRNRVLRKYDSEGTSVKANLFYEQHLEMNNDNFFDKLSKFFKIKLVIMQNNEKFEIGSGKELFILFKNDQIFYHTNAGRIAKLPSGVGKLSNPKHRLDSIISHITGEKIKLESCPLNSTVNFDHIEKSYKIRIEVWSKIPKNGKFDIFRIRKSTKSKKFPLIRLHKDEIVQRFFLIQSCPLYFRGFTRMLKKKNII